MYDELRELNEKINRKLEHIGNLRTMATSSSKPIGQHVQTSSEDRLSNLVCRIVEAEAELDRLIDIYADMKRKAQEEILMLPNRDWQDIVYQHYIENKPISVIADNKGITSTAAYMKNNRAVKCLKKIQKDKQLA